MLIDRFDDRVRRRAHELWEEAGKPLGCNDEFWSRAHDEVMAVLERENAARWGGARMRVPRAPSARRG
jgi:hypothetical protein